MTKRKATPRQLANLTRGREINFQNQLRRKGIPHTIFQREVVRQPVIQQNTTHQHNIKVQLSLFEKFLGTKFFPIEVNKQRENLNLKQIISHIFSRLNNHSEAIVSNQSKTSEIIDYLNAREEEYNQKFHEMEDKISKLEKENKKLKEKIGDVE